MALGGTMKSWEGTGGHLKILVGIAWLWGALVGTGKGWPAGCQGVGGCLCPPRPGARLIPCPPPHPSRLPSSLRAGEPGLRPPGAPARPPAPPAAAAA